MSHAHRASANERALIRAMALTASYLVIEVIGGLLTGSLALLADAGHMLTDVGGLLLAVIAMKLAKRPATPERTFGYYRAEILAAVVNAVVLLGISGWVVVEAYRRWSRPVPIESGPMLAVAVVGLLVNGASLLMLQAGDRSNLNVKGAYFEVLSDLVTSVGVIGGALAIWMTGWTRIDPLISVAIGLFIVPRTWLLLRQAIEVLLEGVPREISVRLVREALMDIDGVAGVHDLHVWSLTSGLHALSVHLVSDADAGGVLSTVREIAHDRFGIEHTTVQIEPVDWSCHESHL